MHNVSGAEQPLRVNLDSPCFARSGQVRDLVSESVYSVDAMGVLNLQVAPYQVLWLTRHTGGLA